MSKRKVKFAEETKDDIDEPAQRRFKETHSLDSDEENEENRPNRMEDHQSFLTEDDIEGQEDDTIKAYDDIKITPFNLREEMEEGHFDSEGNYIADKDEGALHDEWLEGIDWSKIKENETDEVSANTQDEEPEKVSKSDKLKTMKNIIELLKPGENVLKALRRLGGKKSLSKSQKKGKFNKIENEEEDEDIIKENKDNLLRLTEMADMLLQQGDFEIYDKTYEKLNHEVKSQEEQFQDADDDDELEKAFIGGGNSESKRSKVNEDSVENKEIDEIMWEYKWENTEDAEIYGPYQNSCMINWKEQGFFKNGVFCRKIGSNGDFYNSKRIDFELYS